MLKTGLPFWRGSIVSLLWSLFRKQRRVSFILRKSSGHRTNWSSMQFAKSSSLFWSSLTLSWCRSQQSSTRYSLVRSTNIWNGLLSTIVRQRPSPVWSRPCKRPLLLQPQLEPALAVESISTPFFCASSWMTSLRSWCSSVTRSPCSTSITIVWAWLCGRSSPQCFNSTLIVCNVPSLSPSAFTQQPVFTLRPLSMSTSSVVSTGWQTVVSQVRTWSFLDSLFSSKRWANWLRDWPLSILVRQRMLKRCRLCSWLTTCTSLWHNYRS